jgi:hypothetical protein
MEGASRDGRGRPREVQSLWDAGHTEDLAFVVRSGWRSFGDADSKARKKKERSLRAMN